jgi:hypothetical protein
MDARTAPAGSDLSLLDAAAAKGCALGCAPRARPRPPALCLGPVWKRHRGAANATMIDSDNVLLLRPTRPNSGFILERERAPRGSETIPKGLIVATISYLNEAATADCVASFERSLASMVSGVGASILAAFVTECAPNNFPRLPIREGEHALVWFTAFADESSYDGHRARLAEMTVRQMLTRELPCGLLRDLETWRLQPTARSQLTPTTRAIPRCEPRALVGWAAGARSATPASPRFSWVLRDASRLPSPIFRSPIRHSSLNLVRETASAGRLWTSKLRAEVITKGLRDFARPSGPHASARSLSRKRQC